MACSGGRMLGKPMLTRARFFTALVVVGLLLVPPLAVLVDNTYLITLLSRALIFALAALALDFVMGYGRMVSFGHAAFFGLGAYTVGILSTHAMQNMPLAFGWMGSNEALLTWTLAMVVSGLYALIVGLLSLRTSGVYFIMITLALAQLVFFVFVSLSKCGGADGLALWGRNTMGGFSLDNQTGFYYVCLTLLLAAWYVLHRIVRSRFGRVIQGSRQNEQ